MEIWLASNHPSLSSWFTNDPFDLSVENLGDLKKFSLQTHPWLKPKVRAYIFIPNVKYDGAPHYFGPDFSENSSQNHSMNADA